MRVLSSETAVVPQVRLPRPWPATWSYRRIWLPTRYSAPRQRPQMVAETDPERGRGALVVLDQSRTPFAGPAAVGVPGPGEVGDPVPVGPAHVGGDVSVRAVALADLAADHRVAAGDLGERRPARAVTGGVVVGVVRGDERLLRVTRQVGKPLRQVPRPVDSGDQDRLFGPGRAHRLDEFGHPRRPVGADPFAFDLTAVLPAGPADVVGLGVEVEEDGAVVAVRGGDAAPE